MNIDWFTVSARILNFLILLWLMKRFLYKPILNAIDAREKRIDMEIADAAAKKAEAQKEHNKFQQKNEEFDRQRIALLSRVTEEVKAERQRLLEEARKAADTLSATHTCNKRFEKVGILQSEENRRAYRELIVTTPNLGECINGAILYDETIHQLMIFLVCAC